MIIDSANVITYNGLPYSFKPGTGSYVLARDFANDKFSILGNYNDDALTSISVSSGGNNDVYDLLSGGRVSKSRTVEQYEISDASQCSLPSATDANIPCPLSYDRGFSHRPSD